ncbi:MAG: hypothetical protein V7655_07770 [Aequorivita antarctica]
MAWSVLTWKILRISQSQFLSGKVCAETRHSPYTKRYLQAEKMNIKTTFSLLFIICFIQMSFGQDKLKIEKSDNNRLIKVLNNSQLIGENKENYLSVRIYTIDNGSGSAGFESCEVSYNLLVAVSEFDEAPNQSVFEIGPFISPKFIKWTGVKEYEREFTIEHGVFDNRKTIKLKTNLNELILEK